MGIKETLAASQRGPAPKNRVDILLDVLSEIEKIELEEVLFDMSWGHAALTRAIPRAFGEKYPEAKQLKSTSVREWRAKRELV